MTSQAFSFSPALAGLMTLMTSSRGYEATRSVLMDAARSTAVFVGYEVMRWLWPFLNQVAERELYTTLRIRQTDAAFDWVDTYLSRLTQDRLDHPPSRLESVLDVFWPRGRRSAADLALDTAQLVKANVGWDTTKLAYRPFQEATQVVRLGRRTITVTLTQTVEDDSMTYKWYTLRTLFGSLRPLHEILRRARELHTSRDSERPRLDIHHARGSFWEYTASKPIRAWESVILPRGLKERVLEDAREFFEEEGYYRARGLAFRRGYLLHGVPGSGKSSLVAALAAQLGMELYSLSLVSSDLDDSCLLELMSRLPERTILLMEDIDCALREDARDAEDSEDGNDDKGPRPRGKPRNERRSAVTLSGLLNALDGVAASEGRLLIATTNYPHRLDPALSRPGRCDVWIEFSHCTQEQARDLFFHMYSGKQDARQSEMSFDMAVDEKTSLLGKEKAGVLTPPPTPGTDADEALLDMAGRFGRAIPEHTVTASGIQGYLMRYKRRPRDAVENVEQWVEEGFPQALAEAVQVIR